MGSAHMDHRHFFGCQRGAGGWIGVREDDRQSRNRRMLSGAIVGVEPASLILPPTETLLIPLELHRPSGMSDQS